LRDAPVFPVAAAASPGEPSGTSLLVLHPDHFDMRSSNPEGRAYPRGLPTTRPERISTFLAIKRLGWLIPFEEASVDTVVP